MVKALKKGKQGEAAKYITRTQALKKLQLTLKDFRRLCILKGIFPKDPKKYFKGVNKTYYLLRDIKFLSNEKLLTKFREIKSYEKKITKAKKKNEKFDMKKLIENKPKYNLNHIIKERYPRFIDALQDVDDALCLLGIFSNLPKFELLKISPEKVQISQKLLREFYLYTAIAQNYKKGFLSIKGIYLNTEILGQKITWLQPFNYPQKLSFEIDYEIMMNFLELYISLMRFINYKLFKDIGLSYPPPEENYDMPFFGFNSLEIQQFQEKLKKIVDDNNNNEEDLNLQSDEVKKIKEKEAENKKLKNLFSNYVFYVSREVPKEIFEMIIMSCGGLFGDDSDNSPFKEDDKRITHYIVDKPPEFINMIKNKEYIQPQWIFDCVNKKKILPVSDYAPGKKLPPHLSPFYEVDEKGEYIYEDDNNNNSEDNNELNANEEKENKKENKEQKELMEMMVSNNKKKLLQKIREEQLKKKKKKIAK